MSADGIARHEPRKRAFAVGWPELSAVGVLVDHARAVDLALDFVSGEALSRHPGMASYDRPVGRQNSCLISLFHRTDVVHNLDAALRRFAGPRYLGVGGERGGGGGAAAAR